MASLDLSPVIGLCREGRFALARPLAEKLSRRNPRDPSVLRVLAMICVQVADFRAAIASFQKLIELGGHNPADHVNLGFALQSAGEDLHALEAYAAALRLDPRRAVAHLNMGTIYVRLRKFEEALKSFKRSVELAPRDIEALRGLASVLVETGLLKEGADCYARALEIDPDNADCWLGRALALHESNQGKEALTCFQRAFELKPDGLEVHSARALVLAEQNKFDQAFAEIEKALALEPASARVHYNKARVLKIQGRYDEELSSLNTAIAAKPDLVDAVYARSMIRLVRGEYDAGFIDYDVRLDMPGNRRLTLGERSRFVHVALRLPARSDLEGQRLVVFHEQGVGDTVMFASILPDLLAVASNVRLVVDDRLVSLLSSTFPQLTVLRLADLGAPPRFEPDEKILFMGSLGTAFRRSREDFPRTPYLAPDPDRIAAWTARLGGCSTRPKIGVSWKGGTDRTGAEARSLTLADFHPLLGRADVDFVNLQFGDTQRERDEFESQSGVKIIDFPPAETNDLHDLAALIGALDAVVTVQNTNVHVSGALGTPCLAIIPQTPEWRYGNVGAHMAWYDSVEMFRRDGITPVRDLMSGISSRLSEILGA